MKFNYFLLMAFLFSGNSAFAYQRWDTYTPRHIFASQRPFSGNVVLRTKGMINSCGGIFEGNHYRVEVVSCSEDTLSVKVEYQNRVDCDMGMRISKKLRVDVPSECDFDLNAPRSKILINDREFQSF